MLIRREAPEHVDAIRSVTAAAFVRPGADEAPVEARLVDELRACDGWLPALSLVALGPAGDVIGHVVCSRASIDPADSSPDPARAERVPTEPVPVLGLGPLSVHPDHQRRGVGSALMHAVLGAAEALDEPLVVLLGNPKYYRRFGFVLAETLGILPPDPAWRPAFQARPLTAYSSRLRGRFAYAAPFSRI